jgi:putative two-component system response regulator
VNEQAIQDARLLVVDDQAASVLLLTTILRRAGYAHVEHTTDPRRVLALYETFHPDLLLLDLHMPVMDGLAVMQQLRPKLPPGEYFPILVLTADTSREAKQQALAAGAKDFVGKPFDSTEVLLRIRNLLATHFLYQELQEHNARLEARVRERTRELEAAYREVEATELEILDRLGMAAEYRDDATGQHARRVADASARIARALGLGDSQVQLIRRATLLHDVGKIGIPDRVLLKPARLTPEEAEVARAHATAGAKMVAGSRSLLLQVAEEIARTHHERWDGTGYPMGLKGETIPLTGRIVAVADVFDALTHERPYKPPWPADAAVAEIRRLSGRHFDPRVVAAFLDVLAEDGLLSVECEVA